MRFGVRALVVVSISLLLIGGSLMFIKMQRDDDRQLRGVPGPSITPEMRAFLNAARLGRVDDLAALLADYPDLVRASAPSHGTALHAAAIANQAGAIVFLLERGADINARAQWGGTPLHLAAFFGSRDAAATLLARGAGPETRCLAFGATPLFWAAYGSTSAANPAGDYEGVCELLLRAGASPDAFDRSGHTAISLASPGVAHLLQNRGAKSEPSTTPASAVLILPPAM